jgi:hypothetical protein
MKLLIIFSILCYLTLSSLSTNSLRKRRKPERIQCANKEIRGYCLGTIVEVKPSARLFA